MSTKNINLPEYTMLILNTDDFDSFKVKVHECLMNPDYKVMIEFTKADGSNRIMNCTTAEDIINRYIEPKEPDCESTKPRKSNDDVQCVFDIDKKSWRSFRWDRIVEVGISILRKSD